MADSVNRELTVDVLKHYVSELNSGHTDVIRDVITMTLGGH